MTTGGEHPAGLHRIAQLWGEAMIQHAPITAEVNEATAERYKTEWLDRSEAHLAKFAGPIIDMILKVANPPAPIKALLGEVADPQEALSENLEQIFAFGVLSQIVGISLAPFLQSISNELWPPLADNDNGVPLSPAVLADLNVRGIDASVTAITPIIPANAEEAAKSGMSPQDFQALVDSIGNPPSPEDLFDMFRRGIIPLLGTINDQLSVEQGLREGDTRDEWVTAYLNLAYQPLTPDDMVRAAVQNQLTYDDAKALAISLGLQPAGAVGDNPDWFDIAFDIAGRPPGPDEVARMALRGIVPWTGTGATDTTFAQAIAESDIKTKWTESLQALATYWPSPDETKTLYVTGGITLDQAKAYWTAAGLPDALTAAFAHQATTQEIETDKALAKGQIVTLLYDAIITQDQAVSLLSTIGFSGQTAQYIIDITLARREMRALDQAVRKIGSYYVGYKETATDTQSALATLGVPNDQITELLAIWQTERVQPVRLPSIGELAKAVQYAGLPFDTAVSKAELLGYTKYDATLIIAGGAETPPPDGWPADSDPGVDV